MRKLAVLASITALGIAAGLAGCSATQNEPESTELQDVSRDGEAYATTREGAADLDGYTIYRPSDLTSFEEEAVPVLVWGNGGCDSSNINVSGFLTGVASRGYIVVAVGSPAALTADAGAEAAAADPDRLIAAIDWVSEDPAAQSQLEDRIDKESIGLFGWSCGGIEALVASQDERVNSVAGLATGFFPEERMGYDQTSIAGVSSPALIFNGGPEDIAYENSLTTFAGLKGEAVLVSFPAVGHSGLFVGWDISTGWDDPHILPAGYGMVADWFDFTLRDDEEASSQFLGEDCGLCEAAGWSVTTKNFE